MLHAHTNSIPLNTHRRAIRFPPTGTGRDGYIMTDDGGTHVKYRAQGVPNSTCFMRFGKPNRTYRPQG